MGLFGTTMRLFFSVILGIIGIGVVIVGLLTIFAGLIAGTPSWALALIIALGAVLIAVAYFMGKGVW